jgi:hypothetical protein
MNITKEFIKTWRAWNHAIEVPIQKSDYRNAPLLSGIIDELSHLNTYTYCLGLGVISGDTIGKAKIAADDIVTIDRLEAEIEKCNISEETRAHLEIYIKATRALLEEITRLPQE